jgi:YHS domain-containing protein
VNIDNVIIAIDQEIRTMPAEQIGSARFHPRPVRSARHSLHAAGAAALGLLAALAAAPAGAVEPVNHDRAGVAIEGYDPVAYFEQGEPVEGSADHALEWQGATWRFASAAHRDRFAAEPEKYAPQYGGYCAYAVAKGTTAGIDPEDWTVVDGKLYLNYSKKVQKQWQKDIPGHIAKADENWPKLLAE